MDNSSLLTMQSLFFLLAITEINIYLAKKYFVWSKNEVPSLLDFCRGFVHALIFNDLWQREEAGMVRRRRNCKREHTIFTVPRHACQFKNGKWEKSVKAKYHNNTPVVVWDVKKLPDLLFLYCWALVVQVLSYGSCCGRSYGRVNVLI